MSGNADDAPPVPADISDAKRADFQLERYKTELATWTAAQAATATRTEADRAHYRALREDLYKSYLDVAAKQLDRALTRGQAVSTAASAIATLYGAVLGLRFVVGSTAVSPLPTRGLVPTVFLGLAIVLSVAYLAYLTPRKQLTERPSSANLQVDAGAARDDFIEWSSSAVGDRRYVLQMAVVSLGVGVAFLPLAFLDITDEGTLVPWLIGSGIAVVFGPLLLNWTVDTLGRVKIGRPSPSARDGATET
jgi:hypothetical protein